MALRFGLCSTHAPGIFQYTLKGWDLSKRTRARWSPPGPPPPEIALENREEVEERRVARVRKNFATLRERLAEFDPDALIVVGGDQSEWFDSSNLPSIMVYAGGDTWGVHKIGADDDGVNPADDHERFRIDVKVDQQLGQQLLSSLVKQGFDVAISKRFQPLGRPSRGLPHAFIDPLPWLLPRPDLLIVPVIIMTTENTPAILTGERCVALGQAIAKACEGSAKRIAIYGSGGLSHPPRLGWVDEPMDRWFLDQLSEGNVDGLRSMFSYRSVGTVAGTGEDRTWIVVAAAMDWLKPGHHAVVVDYFPARLNITGLGWLYYPAISD